MLASCCSDAMDTQALVAASSAQSAWPVIRNRFMAFPQEDQTSIMRPRKTMYVTDHAVVLQNQRRRLYRGG
uniref:Uncharacterized protein n=1 Tax=Tanacetum cinerariifolium TaxID=118510 RepID=A0A699WJM2_TANCI|nr:hypothetical protein [Tanacetum cinerariifolium]